MNPPSVDTSFPGRISRTLARSLGVGLLGVVLVGGTSLGLAFRILHNNHAVAQEYDHILQLDQVHSVFDDLIAELHQMDSTGRRDRTTDALLMQEEIGRRWWRSARYTEVSSAPPSSSTRKFSATSGG